MEAGKQAEKVRELVEQSELALRDVPMIARAQVQAVVAPILAALRVLSEGVSNG